MKVTFFGAMAAVFLCILVTTSSFMGLLVMSRSHPLVFTALPTSIHAFATAPHHGNVPWRQCMAHAENHGASAEVFAAAALAGVANGDLLHAAQLAGRKERFALLAALGVLREHGGVALLAHAYCPLQPLQPLSKLKSIGGAAECVVGGAQVPLVLACKMDSRVVAGLLQAARHWPDDMDPGEFLVRAAAASEGGLVIVSDASSVLGPAVVADAVGTRVSSPRPGEALVHVATTDSKVHDESPDDLAAGAETWIARFWDGQLGVCIDVDSIPHSTLTTMYPKKGAWTFRYFMRGKEYDYYNKVMDAINGFLRKHKIVHSLHAGTLIGAMRHHGYIPWDDDVDYFILEKDHQRLTELEGELASMGLGLARFGHKENLKIYPLDNFTDDTPERRHEYAWRWPFIDIFRCDTESVSGVASCFKAGGDTKDIIPLESLLPLRPFFVQNELRWGPRLAKQLLDEKYKPTWRDSCLSPYYDHTVEKARNKTCLDPGCTTMPCASLAPFAPFVDVLDPLDGTDAARLVEETLTLISISQTLPGSSLRARLRNTEVEALNTCGSTGHITARLEFHFLNGYAVCEAFSIIKYRNEPRPTLYTYDDADTVAQLLLNKQTEEVAAFPDELVLAVGGIPAPGSDTSEMRHTNSHVLFPTRLLSWKCYGSEPFVEETLDRDRVYALPAFAGLSLRLPIESLGCFKDSKNDRALPKLATMDSPSPADCLLRCLMAGFQYAGLQVRSECWCGNGQYDRHGKAESPGKCVTCGDPSNPALGQFPCGYLGHASVYRALPPEKSVAFSTVESNEEGSLDDLMAPPLTVRAGPGTFDVQTLNVRFAGCYEDWVKNRDLPVLASVSPKHLFGPVGMNAPQMCVSGCLRLGGYTMAGLQAGGECHCGNSVGNSFNGTEHHKVFDTECKPCRTGDGLCGANGRNAIYFADPSQHSILAQYLLPEKWQHSVILRAVMGACVSTESLKMHTPATDSVSLLPGTCLEMCLRAGFSRAILMPEACRCLAFDETVDPAPRTNCDIPCVKGVSAADMPCGGKGHGSVVFLQV